MNRIKFQNKEYLIGLNDKLPDGLSKEYWETYAKLILEDSLPNIFYDLSVDKERPDLRNEKLSIGIEVTNREPQEWQEMTNLYIKSYSHGDTNQRKKALKQIEYLHGKIESEVLLCSTQNRDFNQIYTGVVEKTHKLNTKGFKIFKNNYLFIFTTDHILKEELPKISNEIDKQLQNKKIHYNFDEIFLFYICGDLFRLDINNKTAKYIKNYHENLQLSEEARKIILKKYSSI